MRRFTYDYVHVEFKTGVNKTTLATHKEIIDQCAAVGWRYVGLIITKYVGYGMPAEGDLVFERKVTPDGL